MEIPNKEEWMRSFRDIFSELSDKELPASSYNSFDAIDALVYSTKGLASFRCSKPKCRRYWESQNGVIKFTYRLVLNDSRIAEGEVELFAFGQRCNKCPGSKYIAAKFAPESMEDSLVKLLLKVKEKFYGEDIDREYSEVSSRRHGDPSGEHDSANCQACAQGMCFHNTDYRIPSNPNRGGSRTYSGPRPTNSLIDWVLHIGSSSSRVSASSRSTGTQSRTSTTQINSGSGTRPLTANATMRTSSIHQPVAPPSGINCWTDSSGVARITGSSGTSSSGRVSVHLPNPSTDTTRSESTCNLRQGDPSTSELANSQRFTASNSGSEEISGPSTRNRSVTSSSRTQSASIRRPATPACTTRARFTGSIEDPRDYSGRGIRSQESVRRIAETRSTQEARRPYYSGETSIGYDLSNGVPNSSRVSQPSYRPQYQTSRSYQEPGWSCHIL